MYYTRFNDNGSNRDLVRVPVIITQNPATITSFAASPATIVAGSSASLTAVFSGGTGVITPGNLAVTSGTPVSVSPITTTTYTLTVMPPVGPAITQTATVTVTPAPADFSISVSPSSVSTQMGTTSAPVTVSVTGLNGFSGSVSVAVSGLPAGTVCSPSCPLTISANASVQVSFVVPANAMIGNLALTVQGSSGNLSHSAPLTLGVNSSLQGSWNLWNGSTESVPQGNPTPISGHLFVSGWGFEGIPINAVTVFVDNVALGNAFYGTGRPDVKQGIPGAPEYCGFSLALDTTKLSNGTHTVSVEVTDSVNNVTPMQNYPNGQTATEVNVNNAAPVATGPVANLTVNAPTTSLTEGTIVAFTASATDGSGNPLSPSFTWASTDSTIVKVTPTGAVLPPGARECHNFGLRRRTNQAGPSQCASGFRRAWDHSGFAGPGGRGGSIHARFLHGGRQSRWRGTRGAAERQQHTPYRRGSSV